MRKTYKRGPQEQKGAVRGTAMKRRRKGYALVMCLLVIGVCSSIALTLFHLLKLQTAETHARQDLSVARATLQAGSEHAIALLVDQPALRGEFGPFEAGTADRTYVLSFKEGQI